MKVSVYFWGLGIWVLSISFQKSNKDWPQQPLTENVLKFNISFHDSVSFFPKHKNKVILDSSQTIRFKNLDAFEDLI